MAPNWQMSLVGTEGLEPSQP
ncbi:MAG: hypothetical protein JWM33_3447, partial [Caulobacteraceae bacterium]|nr:hypothetical protein [Caulobacteraceae bacterium]